MSDPPPVGVPEQRLPRASPFAPPQPVTPALSGQWQRLHPISPLVRAGPAVAIVVLLVVIGRGRSSDRTAELIRLGIVVLAAVLGFVSWVVTRWRVAGGALQIDTGLLRRSSLRFPLSQIQAVDIVRPGLARVFDLAELRVRMASGSRSTGRLAYMRSEHAEEVRLQLLDLASTATTWEAPPSAASRGTANWAPFYTVDSGRLVASILLSRPAVALYLIIAGLVSLAAVAPGAAGGAIGGSLGSIIAFARAAWARFNGEFRLSLASEPDGLHLRTGLVQTTAESIPWGRIQAIRTIQPALWRPFGWCRIEADLAGHNVSGRQNRAAKRAGRALVPVGTLAEARWMVDLVMPGAPDGLSKPPLRARWKTPLRYGRLSFAVNERYAVTTSGRLRKVTDRVPLAKIQSVRWSEGPLQRRFRLASLHFDTAGRSVYAIARDRDAGEAASLLGSLPDACRQARVARAGTPVRPT
ncbi:MAG: PH domain-containing protein [Acidimicrobiales bacterium]